MRRTLPGEETTVERGMMAGGYCNDAVLYRVALSQIGHSSHRGSTISLCSDTFVVLGITYVYHD